MNPDPPYRALGRRWGTYPRVVSTGLTKRFRHQVVVDHIDLDVPSGAVYGFLGPNGSGKTTTIRMLLGLISATEGRIELLGESMPAAVGSVLRRVGALVEGSASTAPLGPRQSRPAGCG